MVSVRSELKRTGISYSRVRIAGPEREVTLVFPKFTLIGPRAALLKVLAGVPDGAGIGALLGGLFDPPKLSKEN